MFLDTDANIDTITKLHLSSNYRWYTFFQHTFSLYIHDQSHTHINNKTCINKHIPHVYSWGRKGHFSTVLDYVALATVLVLFLG